MRTGYIVLLFCASAFAAVNGTVVNGTTGKPQAGATVTLYKFGQGAMEAVDHVNSDAGGKFSFNRDVPSNGPSILRTEFDGVTYNHMMPPGSPTANLTIDVYNSSKEPGAAKVTKHMIMFEPSGGQMTVNEILMYQNDGKTTWNNPAEGTLRFYLPAAAKGTVEVKATAPNGMPVPAPVEKTSKPDVYAAKFEIKPGETRFDIAYAVPYTEGAPYEGKVITKDDNTYLIAPNGVTLKGTGLNDMGPEPRTQAHIYGLDGTSYKIQLTGTETAPPASADAGAGDQAENAGPQIEQIMPRVYGNAKLILGLALGILALGFALLYRTPSPPGPAKEGHERGRG
jgi:hypothetical protein